MEDKELDDKIREVMRSLSDDERFNLAERLFSVIDSELKKTKKSARKKCNG